MKKQEVTRSHKVCFNTTEKEFAKIRALADKHDPKQSMANFLITAALAYKAVK